MKADGRRVPRVEKEVQQCIAQFLIKNYQRSLPGLVTVSRVMMPADLRMAKVYISVLSEKEDAIEQTIEFLDENVSEIQRFIGQELRMRYCPTLKFFKDETTEKVLKIESILKDLQENPSSEDKD